MTRRALAVGILAAWAGTLGWLGWRMHDRGGRAFATGSAPVLPPEAHFYVIRASGRQVGVASLTLDTVPEGIRVTERMGLDIPLKSEGARSQFTGEYVVGPDLALVSFEMSLPGSTSPARMAGTYADSAFVVRLLADTGRIDSLRFASPPLPPPLLAAVALALQGNLRVGVRTGIPVFDPILLRDRRVDLWVTAESTFMVPDSAEFDSTAGTWVTASVDTVRAWLVNRKDEGVTSSGWVDARGLPVRTSVPTGLSLERSAFEIVTVNYRRQRLEPGSTGWTGSVIPQTVVAAGARLPSRRLGRVRLLVTAGGMRWPEPSMLTAGIRQQVRGDTLSVTIRPAAEVSGQDLSEELLERWLADEPMLALRDSAVQAVARRVMAEQAGAEARARALAAWVARTLAPAAVPLAPPVPVVLRRGWGDVDDHTLAFVALARAAGIPARPVSGLLLAPDGLFLHSWAEVFLSGWVAVDPTAGQFPADAGRIRLAVNELARPMHLLPRVASLQATILETTEAP